jgi:hypothetical protein
MANQGHLKKESFARMISDVLSSIFHLSIPEIISILCMVALLTFFTTITFVYSDFDQSSKIIVTHQGFPFDNLRIVYTPKNGSIIPHMSTTRINGTFWFQTLEISGSGLSMNLIIYSLLSFGIVKTYAILREEIYYYKHNKG